MKGSISAVVAVSFLALSAPAIAQRAPAGPLGAVQDSVSSLEATVSDLRTTVTQLQSAVSALQSQAGGDQALASIALGDPVFAASRSMEDMPGMTTTFQTTSLGCVSATISAQMSASSAYFSGLILNDTLFVSVLLDGTPMGGHSNGGGNDPNPPGTVAHGVLDDASPSLASYTFVTCDVPAAMHAVTIQWQCPFDFQGTNEDGVPNGRFCSVSSRTLLVRGR